MNILLAPDSFKGTFHSREISAALEAAILRHHPTAHIKKVVLSDGGEGFVDAVLSLLPGKVMTHTVTGPYGHSVQAKWAILSDGTGVIEMAQASGLGLDTRRNPLAATSFGTGELISQALDAGCQRILLGLGGSATNDGGLDMLKALGAQVSYIDHNEHFGGAGLNLIDSIDLSSLDPRILHTKLEVMCDVQNPLLGLDGATYTFGPQKGADHSMLSELEAGLCRLAQVIQQSTGISLDSYPGGGAAGGMGAMLLGVLHANFHLGIDFLLGQSHFEQLVAWADLVITGEGRIDGQSTQGKVLSGIGKYCKDVRLLALCGVLGPDYARIYEHHIDGVMPIVSDFMDFPTMLSKKEEYLKDAADRLVRLVL